MASNSPTTAAMTSALQAIFEPDGQAVSVVRSRIAKWASSLISEKSEIQYFTAFVTEKIKTWKHCPRVAFLVLAIVSDDSCKTTISLKYTSANWEKSINFLVRVICVCKAKTDNAASITEHDLEQCLQVSHLSILPVKNFVSDATVTNLHSRPHRQWSTGRTGNVSHRMLRRPGKNSLGQSGKEGPLPSCLLRSAAAMWIRRKKQQRVQFRRKH